MESVNLDQLIRRDVLPVKPSSATQSVIISGLERLREQVMELLKPGVKGLLLSNGALQNQRSSAYQLKITANEVTYVDKSDGHTRKYVYRFENQQLERNGITASAQEILAFGNRLTQIGHDVRRGITKGWEIRE
ncbi:hypothetical protein EBR96_02395 [bacterium]|nr:hypothetical protein [bacterium]